MDTITDFDKLDAPFITFDDLSPGLGEKVEIGDTVIARKGPEEATAKVIEIDKELKRIYLCKALPKEADLSIEETSTGSTAQFEGIKKGLSAIADEDSDEREDDEKDTAKPKYDKDVLTGPLPELKKLIIKISVNQG